MYMITFDGDGVLFNSMDSYTRTFTKLLKDKHGIPYEHSIHFYTKSAGMDLLEQFKHMLLKYHRPLVHVTDLVNEFFEIQKKIMPPLFDDVIPALESLKGLRMYVASGTLQKILDSRIENYGLNKYFQNCVGYSQNNNKRTYLEFLSSKKSGLFDKYNDKLFFVADGLKDMELAKELKIIGIGLARNKGSEIQKMKEAGASEVITTLTDLKKTIYSHKFLI